MEKRILSVCLTACMLLTLMPSAFAADAEQPLPIEMCIRDSLYVEQFSMGQSQGDNGLESLDMPYLIVAKDKAAVDKGQEIKAEAESDPTALRKKLESGALGDYQVPVMYSNIHANEVAASDGILAFAWMLVETAASESGTIDYDKLTGFTAAGKAELAEQMGPCLLYTSRCV